jgi:hypothetical protein
MNILRRTAQKASHAMGIGPKAKTTKTKPVYLDPAQFKTARADVKFEKAQGVWDEAQRVVSEATNEKDLRKAIKLMVKAKIIYDAAFTAHRKG